MPRYKNYISSDNQIEGGLILDSRDIFSKERYEERIDYKLAVLMQRFEKKKQVPKKELEVTIGEFIADVEAILKKLEDMKRREEQEEYRRIQEVRTLLEKGSKINIRNIRNKLEKLGKKLISDTNAALIGGIRREKRLRKGKAPLGYVLKKVKKEKSLDIQIARKAGKELKNNQREHELIREIELLIKELNNRPTKKGAEELSKRIRKVTDNYEKDLQCFLNIEIDIELEEARKLHRIDHYIKFLKKVGNFENLIQKLEGLRKKAEYWVYQDSVDVKRLLNYAKSLNYGLEVLKTSKKDTFTGIEVVNSPINNIIPGILIYNPRQRYNKGVVMMHGIVGNKESFTTLGKRLALQGYLIYSIDMTSHGDNREKFRLGRNSEYLLETVRWFRLNGIKNIGVIGHSAGATSTLFALCGYNTKVENEFYLLMTKLINRARDIIRKAKGKEVLEKGEIESVISLSREYKALKSIVSGALERMIKGQSRIQAAVMLAPPLSFQAVFPGAVARIGKLVSKGNLRKKTTRLLLKKLTEMVNKGIRSEIGEDAPQHKYVAKEDETQLISLVVADVYEFFNYVEKIKNPLDFISLLDFLCDSIEKPDQLTTFFRYYRENIIRKTPKLFIYGLKDELLRPLKKNNMEELEKHYEQMGLTKVKKYPNVMHLLNKEGKGEDYEVGKLPQMSYEIISFLNSYLGKGKLV